MNTFRLRDSTRSKILTHWSWSASWRQAIQTTRNIYTLHTRRPKNKEFAKDMDLGAMRE